MSFTFDPGERMIYHKRPNVGSLKPGALLIYENSESSAWGHPGDQMISRILANSEDRISIKDGYYEVNGRQSSKVGSTGDFKVTLEVPTYPDTIQVPENSFFVVQEGGFDSQVFSWVHKDSILGTRIWSLSFSRLLEPILRIQNSI